MTCRKHYQCFTHHFYARFMQMFMLKNICCLNFHNFNSVRLFPNITKSLHPLRKKQGNRMWSVRTLRHIKSEPSLEDKQMSPMTFVFHTNTHTFMYQYICVYTHTAGEFLYRVYITQLFHCFINTVHIHRKNHKILNFLFPEYSFFLSIFFLLLEYS